MGPLKKYYRAYDDRYRAVHARGLLWFSGSPTPELLRWLEETGPAKGERICDVGCGEGRDALCLASLGFRVTAADVSPQAIRKCRAIAREKSLQVVWKVADALNLPADLGAPFFWIYSIGTLHVLVTDEDRREFLASLRACLAPGGRLLLVSKGDGRAESATDPTSAFVPALRTHEGSGAELQVASTSYRSVSWPTHRRELREAGFLVEREMNTVNHEYGRCLTVYLRRPG